MIQIFDDEPRQPAATFGNFYPAGMMVYQGPLREVSLYEILTAGEVQRETTGLIDKTCPPSGGNPQI